MAEHKDWSEADDAALAARVAAPLREPVYLEGSFEERLMKAVRELAPELYPALATRPDLAPPQWRWWRRPRELMISPLAGLAIAAGFAGLVAVGTLAIARRGDGSSSVPVALRSSIPATDTVQLVRFVFVDPAARTVSLVGDFNAWTRDATLLARTGAPGVWAASVPLLPGRHEYAFIINGKRWSADPLALQTRDDFGTESSVIHVPRGTPSAT